MEAIFGLIGVILGAFLTVITELFNDWRTRKTRAKYLAIRVTVIFENFIQGCVDMVSDDGYMNGPSENGCRYASAKVPEIDFQTLDVDWHSLPFDLLYEILLFPSLVQEANTKIFDAYDVVATPPDYEEWFEERQFQYAKLGLLAFKIATDLRSKYKMPEKVYEDWDPIDFLRENKKKIDDLRIKREKKYQLSHPIAQRDA